MADGNLSTIISAQQCKHILRKFNEEHDSDLKFLRYAVLPAEEAEGILREYFHLIIRCSLEDVEEIPDDEEEDNAIEEVVVEDQDEEDDEDITILKLFIKKLSLVQKEHEQVISFRKECSLYSTLLTELPEYSSHPWCPKAYLCSTNLLVLQDLDDLGYQSLAYKENLEEFEMLPILKGLASMHASSLLYELYDKSIEDSHNDCLKEITVHPDIPWFTTGIQALLEIAKCHPQYQAEVSQKFISDELPHYLKSIYFMVNPSPKYRNVVCHRDTWGGNIFINPQDPEASAIFVDFQTCRYCPPAIDVIFTLFMNLTKEERLERQAEYLQYYWEQLQSFASSDEADENWGLSETEFLESFEELKLFGYVYRALAATILKVPKELVTDDYKNVERSQKLLEYMDENEEFRLLMEECVEDIIEAVVDISLQFDTY